MDSSRITNSTSRFVPSCFQVCRNKRINNETRGKEYLRRRKETINNINHEEKISYRKLPISVTEREESTEKEEINAILPSFIVS